MSAQPGPASYAESAHVWGAVGLRCVGVLAQPADRAKLSGIAVLVIVGGPQVRVGSHRQFVQLARRLAAAGHAVLRFDVPGMGDSEGPAPHFERLTSAIAEALMTLQSLVPSSRRLVLWGLCDGASAALLHQHERAKSPVRDVVLLNPWVRNAGTEAATQLKHYYTRRVRDPSFWRKLLSGGIGLAALSGLMAALRRTVGGRTAGGSLGASTADAVQAPYFVRMAEAWHAHRGRILLIQSGNDYTAREFDEALSSMPAWRGAERHPRLVRVDVPQADHTFSRAEDSRLAEDATIAFLAEGLES